jgi:hypothetical protein
MIGRFSPTAEMISSHKGETIQSVFTGVMKGGFPQTSEGHKFSITLRGITCNKEMRR